MALANSLWIHAWLYYLSWKEKAVTRIQERYDAWYVVYFAVLLGLAFTIYAALMIWCVVYKGKSFSGDWHWSWKGVSVKTECV